MAEKAVSNEALAQIFRSMKDEFVTANDVKTVVIENKQGVTLLERNKEYNVGDMLYSDKLTKGLFLECIEGGTTSDSEPTI